MAGLGDVETEWTQHGGPAVDLDALLSGQADFIGPGVPTLATIWDKTVGTPHEARALIAMQSMPWVLVTRNPAIKTIADFTDKDKIALPAVKLTGHAIALEMEVAKIWGADQYDKLDSITITRRNCRKPGIPGITLTSHSTANSQAVRVLAPATMAIGTAVAQAASTSPRPDST